MGLCLFQSGALTFLFSTSINEMCFFFFSHPQNCTSKCSARDSGKRCVEILNGLKGGPSLFFYLKNGNTNIMEIQIYCYSDFYFPPFPAVPTEVSVYEILEEM